MLKAKVRQKLSYEIHVYMYVHLVDAFKRRLPHLFASLQQKNTGISNLLNMNQRLHNELGWYHSYAMNDRQNTHFFLYHK